ncbi:MAG: 1-acyl-sn-glycerol-3-phosphate acyltransferase [Pseudomonadota bacterium]
MPKPMTKAQRRTRRPTGGRGPRFGARPATFRGPFTEAYRWLCMAYLYAGGWRMEGDWPGARKVVAIAAPHTSNWDGINMIAAAGYYRIKFSWMGKASLVKGPFGGMVRWLGCVPVERSGGGDVVAQTAAAFDAADELILAIAPEGTRDRVTAWKTGLYHIAVGAGVPILPTVLDYGRRRVLIAPLIEPTGDYANDLPKMQAPYKDAEGLIPDRWVAPGTGDPAGGGD